MTEEESRRFILSNVNIITRLQAWARGNLARKQVEFLKSKQIGSARYFVFAEFKETPPDASTNGQRAEKPPYTYTCTGAVYKGKWKNGLRDGVGCQAWPDGATYDGEWKDNKACGHGKFTHVEGDTYEGQWANDKANGYGVYQHVNGAKYQGYWKDDLQHGLGVETWIDESKYEGEYSFGRKHGLGTYKWSDGSAYSG